MRRFLIIALLLLTSIRLEPIHHRIKNALVEYGILDTWTLFHFGQGVGYGFIRKNTTINETLWYWFGWKWPSPNRIILEDFILATAWEIFEFGYEGNWDWDKYQKMYSGHALVNNSADIAFSVLGTYLTVSNPRWLMRLFRRGAFTGIEMEVRL